MWNNTGELKKNSEKKNWCDWMLVFTWQRIRLYNVLANRFLGFIKMFSKQEEVRLDKILLNRNFEHWTGLGSATQWKQHVIFLKQVNVLCCSYLTWVQIQCWRAGWDIGPWMHTSKTTTPLVEAFSSALYCIAAGSSKFCLVETSGRCKTPLFKSNAPFSYFRKIVCITSDIR